MDQEILFWPFVTNRFKSSGRRDLMDKTAKEAPKLNADDKVNNLNKDGIFTTNEHNQLIKHYLL